MPQDMKSLKVWVNDLYHKSTEGKLPSEITQKCETLLANLRNGKAHIDLAESLQKLANHAVDLGDYAQAKELCVLARMEYIVGNEFTSDRAVKAYALEGVRSMELLLFSKITPKLKKKWWQFWK